MANVLINGQWFKASGTGIPSDPFIVEQAAGSGSAGLTDTQLRATAVPVSVGAGSAALGKIITPGFSVSDHFTRPANAGPYAINKSINIDLTVTGFARSGNTITLTSNGHGLVTGDRITVAGVNTGATATNVDGNWVVSAYDANTISFVVTSTPTGTTPQSGLTITHAIMKMLSFDVAGKPGGGVILSRLSVSLPGVGMTGAVRAYLYTAQTTILYDNSTFTLLTALDTYRKEYYDLTPVTEGSGSDVTFASKQMWEYFKCEAADTRLYMRLVAEAAGTPASAGIVTARLAGVQLDW